jgi:predicted Zn-dependent peptidase
MWSAYDHAKRVFFADHPLGHSILGTPASITALSRDQMHEYFSRRYVPTNITVSVAGNFDWDRIVALVTERCGGWSPGTSGRQGVRPAPSTNRAEVIHKATVSQEHVYLLSPGPAADSPLRHAADVLAMVIGDDSGSRLYWTLVDPGLAESADMSFHEYEGTGVFYTSFSGEPEQTVENLEIIRGVLRQVQDEGVTTGELNQAKSKVLSRVVRGSERPMGRMQALGMAWTYLGTYRSVDDELRAFEAVTLKEIREVLNQFPLVQTATLALGPLEALPSSNGHG